MSKSSEDNRPGGGDLRLWPADSRKEASSPQTSGTSSDTSGNRSASPKPCTVNGAVLLETEHVLLRVAPHLLACTSRIRREGWIRPAPTESGASFRNYAVIVPIEAVRQILAELERAAAVYCPDYLPMLRLVEHWREVHEKCRDCQ